MRNVQQKTSERTPDADTPIPLRPVERPNSSEPDDVGAELVFILDEIRVLEGAIRDPEIDREALSTVCGRIWHRVKHERERLEEMQLRWNERGAQ